MGMSTGDSTVGPLAPEATFAHTGLQAIHLLLAVAAVAAAAQLAVPIPGTPIPVSLQDLTMLGVGVVLGPGRGVAAMAAYVALGAMGAPVFSNGHGGFPWLLGPTGGYLAAYPAACWVMGRVWMKWSHWLGALAGALLAQCVIYVGAVTQLVSLTSQGVVAAVGVAVVPFLAGALFKTALLVVFATSVQWFGRATPSEEDPRLSGDAE